MTHMHGAKESQNLIVKLSNAHSQVAKSLTKQNCFKKNYWERKTLPHCTRCSQTSQPLWNAVSIAVRPEWLVDPRDSTRRLEQANNNIDMADCKSPIVSARCQPLRHNVAIRSVFNKALVTSINTFYWGEDLEAPRSMEASSSSLLQLKSCGESIQTTRNWLNTNWQVINATATSKEVAGTDNGASSWLNISIFDGAMASSSSFLIASERNKLSIKHDLVFITHYFVCLLNVNEGTALHMNRKPWTHSTCCRCGRSALHVSFLFWKMFLVTRWKKFCLRSALSLNMPVDVQVEIQNILSKFRPSMHCKAFNKYMSGMRNSTSAPP